MKTKKILYDKIIKKIKKSRKITFKNNNLSTSFSPEINRKIDVNKLKTLEYYNIKLCNNLLEIYHHDNDECLNYKSKKVQKILLNNLTATKHLNVNNFIPPKQIYSNCWFNTMFVNFFYSDKGRKFFRFFRNLMITGRKYDKSPIENIKLKKLFFILNLYIEASYNQNNTYLNINKLTNNLNTNYIIKHIYNIINYDGKNKNIPNINDEGNPLDYYLSIMNYLNYNILKILRIPIYHKYNFKNIVKFIDIFYKNVYDIIIIEDYESNSEYKEYFIKNNIYKYKLDSIILTNKDHFNPKKNSHFVSLITINNSDYKFDGSSLSKLSKFKWRNYLNRNIDWDFKENSIYKKDKYNLTKGYKLLFYYRTK
tara:strand:+ start:11280 stop:12380 length:1101 start_codon:yes stop_codon:yes gene_type:complete